MEEEILEYLDEIGNKRKLIKLLKKAGYYSKVRIEEGLPNKQRFRLEIGDLRDENLKMKFLEEITDESVRAYLISTMTIEDIFWLSDELDKMENDKNKLFILTKAKNFSSRTKKQKKLNYAVKKAMQIDDENKKYSKIGLPPDMTAGIEIEAEGMWAELLIILQKNILDWKIKDDYSLDEGIEITSPHMRDREEDVKEIYQITSMMKEFGFEESERCGAHVHIGADYLDKLEEYKELFEIYGNAEKILYLISNKPGELPRSAIKAYAMPNSSKWTPMSKNPETKDEFLDIAKDIQGHSKKCAINIKNVGSIGKNTVEFRLANGTLDGNVWVENIRLFGRIMQASKEIAQIKEKQKENKEISPEEKNKMMIKYRLKHEKSEKRKMRHLMELLFSEEEREVYWERYNKNNELAEKSDFFRKLKFNEVNFEDIFTSNSNKQEEKDEDNER